MLLAGLLVGLLGGCVLPGGGRPDEEAGPSAGTELAEELGALTRRTAPGLAEASNGEVAFANGSVESCEGGSFDGPTAVGHLVRARLDPAPDVRGDAAVPALADGLAATGWEVAEPDAGTPGRVVVGGTQGDARLTATVNEDFSQVLSTLAGPCRPVDDASRDEALGSQSRRILPTP